MSNDRQPTRPPSAQCRPGTPATYPIAQLTQPRWQKPAAPRTAAEVRRKPLTNYVAFTKDSLGRWTFALHQGKTTTPLGMSHYSNADAAYRDALGINQVQPFHILLTSDFLSDLRACWDEEQREAQATPRAWELP